MQICIYRCYMIIEWMVYKPIKFLHPQWICTSKGFVFYWNDFLSIIYVQHIFFECSGSKLIGLMHAGCLPWCTRLWCLAAAGGHKHTIWPRCQQPVKLYESLTSAVTGQGWEMYLGVLLFKAATVCTQGRMPGT